MSGFTITAAVQSDLADVRAMFAAYALSLPVDLGAQGFEAELANLPGPYGAPGGALLIARSDTGEALGCIAFRRLDADACEVKRLYVLPSARGMGLGKALIAAVIAEARRARYRLMKLDTLPTMQAAIAIYRDHGFVPIEPYGSYPYPGLMCLGKTLAPTPG